MVTGKRSLEYFRDQIKMIRKIRSLNESVKKIVRLLDMLAKNPMMVADVGCKIATHQTD